MEDRYYNEDYTYSQALEANATPSCIIDQLEPLQEDDIYRMAYREASKKFLGVINAALTYIDSSKDKDIAIYQVGLAVESGICDGKSMEQLSAKLRCTRAALSKGAKAFCRQNNLPPSSYMKKASSSKSYREARIQSIHNSNNATKEK